MKIGIDIGSTNTKLVLASEYKILKKLFVNYTGIQFIDFLSNVNIDNLKTDESIVATGVGSSYIRINNKIDNLVNNKIIKQISEINATAKGALTLTGLNSALVVSCGTGTAFIHAKSNKIKHIGGSGVGGGTIIGLSKLFNIDGDIDKIKKLALMGDTNKIDTLIEDISLKNTKLLRPNVTASNFGKVMSCVNYNKYDISSSIFNLVYQTIAMLSVYAARSVGETNVILVGAMSESEFAKKVLLSVGKLHNDINFYIPQDGIYACALGATLL